jgi:haloalkane dehalogenase
MRRLRALILAVTSVASTIYALMLGVYAVASTRPELNTQPQTQEEIRATLAGLGIEGEYDFTHGFAQTPRGRMHYVETGTGSPILFLHGSPTWSYLFRHLMDQLSSQGRLIAPDLIGFGLSQKLARPRDYTLEGHIQDVSALIDRLALRDVVLVVHGWGAPIGMGVWLRDPGRIRGVVVLNSIGFQAPGGSLPTALTRDVLRTPLLGEELVQGLGIIQRLWLPAQLDLPRARERSIVRSYALVQGSWSERAGTLAFARMFPRDPGDDSWVMARAQAALRTREPRALIVWGAHDSSFGPSALLEWRTQLPNAAVEEIASAGVLLPEEAPELTAAAISGFLRGL